MCQQCRNNAHLMLCLILPTIAGTVEAHNDKMDVEHPEARKPADDISRAEQVKAFELLYTIARDTHPLTSAYTNPQEASDAMRDLLVANPETRASIRVLLMATKFAAHTAQLLEDYAAVLYSAVKVRAHDEADPLAVRYVLGEDGEMMEAIRKRSADRTEERHAERFAERATERLGRLADALERSTKSGKSGAPTPDFRH